MKTIMEYPLNSESLPALDIMCSTVDVHSMTMEELKLLTQEVRRQTINKLAKTGKHLRANLAVVDLAVTLRHLFNAPYDKINGQIFNVGFKNQSVNELANDVKEIIGSDIEIINTKSDDNRSYHVSSEKIKEVLNFSTKFSVKDAVQDLKDAFEKKILLNTFNDELYFNIKRMNNINLV